MRLREFLEMQKRSKQQLNEWKSTGAVYTGHTDKEWEDWVENHGWSIAKQFVHRHGREGLYDWYYNNNGPYDQDMLLDGDILEPLAQDWIDTYKNKLSVKDVLTDDFYKFVKDNFDLDKDAEITVRRFTAIFLTDYLEAKNFGEDTVLVFNYQNDYGSNISLYGDVVDSRGNPMRGAVVFDLVADPCIFIWKVFDFYNLLDRVVTQNAPEHEYTVEEMVNLYIDLFN